MSERPDPGEAFLSTALEERAGGHPPPDLTERIMARAGEAGRRRPSRLLAAAMLLFGAGVLAAVYLLSSGARDDAANGPSPVPAPEQDPVPESVVEPVDRAGWQALLADVQTISAVVFMLPGSRIPTVGAGWPAPPSVPVAQKERARELATALAALEPRGYDGPWEVSHTLWLHLGGQRKTRVELQCTSRPWVLRLPPLGMVVVETELMKRLAPEIAQANRLTQVATGIVGADDVKGDRFDMIADDARVLRVYQLDREQIAVVLHYRDLEQLDLSGSPALHEPEVLGQLAGLPRLTAVHLNAPWTDPGDVGALGGIRSLKELRLATVPGGKRIKPLTDGVVDAVLELPLGAVALPGEMVADRHLELLSESERLQALDLGKSDVDAGLVTPAGLAAVASMKSLRRLVLDGWFSAGFSFTNFGLTFQDTDGDGLPDARVPGPHEAELDAEWRSVLSKLACQSTVRDLSLRGCRRLGYDDVVSWKGALDLDRLDLTGCPGFTIEQIRELRAALPACQIVW